MDVSVETKYSEISHSACKCIKLKVAAFDEVKGMLYTM